MKTYTLPEFKKELKANGYKYIGFFDANDEQLCTYNNTKISIEDKLTEIGKKLKSARVPDGLYFIKCKNNTRKDAHTENYPIQKGKGEIVPPQQLAESATPPAQVLTYPEVLELRVQLQGLERDKADLEKQIEQHEVKHAEHEATIVDLNEQLEKVTAERDELAEESEGLNERSTEDALTGLFAVAEPFINKYFEQNDKKLQLKAIELHQNSQKMPNAAAPAQRTRKKEKEGELNEEAVDLIIDKIERYTNESKNDPEKFEMLERIYKDVDNLDEFFGTLKAEDEETFVELVEYINA